MGRPTGRFLSDLYVQALLIVSEIIEAIDAIHTTFSFSIIYARMIK
ncbi:hypothetical protein ACO0LM_15625 [Undibacterium sp. Di26W]